MVVVAVASAVLPGCTRHRAERAPLTPTSARAAAPSSGGAVVRVGVQEEPASLNPFDVRSRTRAAADVLGAVLPQLFVVAPNGDVRGSLVDDSSVREKLPSSVSFSLRRGAQWSDGTPITADDIRFTWEAIRSDQWHGPRDGYDTITAVEGNDRSVTLRFSSPLPGWKRLFSQFDYVLPAHRLRGQPALANVWGGGPDVFAGPYKLAGVTPGLEVDLDRNEKWWGDAVAFDRVRVLVVPDGRTLEQLLDAGELDVAAPVAGTSRVSRFKALRSVSLSVADAGGQVTTLIANTEKVGLTRRRSLFALVDRDHFASVLLDGEVSPAASLMPGRDSGPWKTVSADAAAAKRELAQNVTVTMAAPDSEAMAGLLGRAMQTRLEGLAATLELEFAGAAEVDSTWRPTGRFDLMLSTELQWPQPCWRCEDASDAVDRSNYARVKTVDDLAAAADRSADGAAALETRLHDDAVVLPMWRPRTAVATRGIRGATANSWAPGPLWDVVSWRKA